MGAKQTSVADEVFTAWAPDGSLGLISGWRRGPTAHGYWAVVARRGKPMALVTDFELPIRAHAPTVMKGEQLWAEHQCDDPERQWSVGNETYAVALDAPSDALASAYGHRLPIGFDLEFYRVDAVGEGLDASSSRPKMTSGANHVSYACRVYGVVELGADRVEFDDAPGRRDRRELDVEAAAATSLRFEPLRLPPVVAHVGVEAVVPFPGGWSIRWVLTPAGWREAVS